MDVSQEDYLKTIYILWQEGSAATVTALARRLNVRPASVTEMLGRLSDHGLIRREPRGPATLTESGTKVALRVIRRHRLLEQFLYRVLGMPWDQVHEEAEALEHAVSPRLEARISEMLGYPKRDPHGDPIPAEDLSLSEEEACVKLGRMSPGQKGVVVRVTVQEPERLRYLGGLGLYPESHVEVVGKEPFGGPLRLLVDGEERWLGSEIAMGICVRLEREPGADPITANETNDERSDAE